MALSKERIENNRTGIGEALKAARERQGMTQKALAAELGLEYYTMISQMELGYISVPALRAISGSPSTYRVSREW